MSIAGRKDHLKCDDKKDDPTGKKDSGVLDAEKIQKRLSQEHEEENDKEGDDLLSEDDDRMPSWEERISDRKEK